MYVFCSGMYRACSTWQYQVACHLLGRHRPTSRLGYLTGEEFADHHRDHGASRGDSFCVLKSHEEHPLFRDLIRRGEATAIYAHRDIRDVIYSLMHKRQRSFESILRSGMIHQVLANDRFWASRPGVLIQRYDDLVLDPAGGVMEIARHLGLSLDPREAEEVAALFSFQANRARATELGERLRASGAPLDDPSYAQAWDRENLLHWNHLRDGRVGGWRDLATPAQRWVLSRLCDGWLRGHGYDVEPDVVRPAARRERLEMIAAIARGRLACTLRCASLRHPRLARMAKRCLGLSTAPHPDAAPVPIPAPHAPVGHVSRSASYRASA